jgi:hypothetical protein
MVQEGRHTRHLLPGGFAPLTCQPVVPSALVVGRRPACDFFNEPVFEHLLDRTVKGARAQLDLATATLGDVQHDSVSVEWLVGQCNQDVEDRWGHGPFGKQRLWHDTATISDSGYIRKSMLLGALRER